MSNYYVVYSNELYHHGIIGQQWGVRNGPPYPLGAEDHSAAEKKAGRKSQNKSERRKTLQKNYESKGYSKEQSNRLVDNRLAFEKALKITAGVAVTGLLAYGAYQIGKNYSRKLINSQGTTLKVGDTLHRISGTYQDSIDYDFYAVKDKMDAIKYEGKLGPLRRRQNIYLSDRDEVFKTTIGVTKDIKVASQDDAQNIFNYLMAFDPSFNREVSKQLLENPLMRYLGGNSATKSDYHKFNQLLVDHNTPEMQELTDKFFTELKANGFGAILDVNDQKYSGYNAKAPIIVFDKDAVMVDYCEKLGWGKMLSSSIVDNLAEHGDVFVANAGLLSSKIAYNKYKKNEESITNGHKSKK